jgi:hypothetical protein
MNIKKEELEMGINQAQIEPEKSKVLIEYVEQLIEDKKKDKTESKEYRLVGLVFKGDENLPINERPIIVVKQEVTDEPVERIVDQIHAAARKHNEGKKTKKNPVSTIVGTLFECTKKNLREEEVNMQGDGQLYVIEIDRDLTLGGSDGGSSVDDAVVVAPVAPTNDNEVVFGEVEVTFDASTIEVE